MIATYLSIVLKATPGLVLTLGDSACLLPETNGVNEASLEALKSS